MAIIVEHLINGQNVSGVGDRHQDVFNPATGEVTKQVSLASKATMEEAISAAEAAFPAPAQPGYRRLCDATPGHA